MTTEPRQFTLAGDVRIGPKGEDALLVGLLAAVLFFSTGGGCPFGSHGHGRIQSNERSAIASLKCIAAGQEQFKNAAAVDEDGDGVGAYGTLEELGGVVACRGSRIRYEENPFIPRVLGTTDPEGISSKGGYRFRLFFPKAGPAAAGDSDFLVLAWPTLPGRSGVRIFAITSQGQPFSAAALDADGRDPDPALDGIGQVLDPDGRARFDLVQDGTSGWVPVG